MVRPIGRKTIVVIAVLISVVMYFAGVLSGLYANKVVEHKVKQDVDLLKSYTDSSALDMKNMLLLQFFMENMDDRCRFSKIYLSDLYKQLHLYWQKLPARLEAYEREGAVSDDYVVLKREYTRLSLRIWLIAQTNYGMCNDTEFIPFLYFYSKDCDTCVRQGEIIDSLKQEESLKNKTLVGFPVDADFPDDAIFLLKEYYNVTGVPTIIINRKVLHEELVPLDALMDAINNKN